MYIIVILVLFKYTVYIIRLQEISSSPPDTFNRFKVAYYTHSFQGIPYSFTFELPGKDKRGSKFEFLLPASNIKRVLGSTLIEKIPGEIMYVPPPLKFLKGGGLRTLQTGPQYVYLTPSLN